MTDLLTAPCATPVGPVGTGGGLVQLLEEHRRGLTAHCRRVLGSASEADDAVQETFVRAWRAADRFEGRSSLRTWLHRIATNVCLDMLAAAQRRAVPADLASWTAADDRPAGAAPDARQPWSAAPGHPGRPDDDPAERAVAREAVRLALAAALLHLPPRQRSVLLLREVLGWRTAEVAALLGTTVASVNSALQRARANLAGAHAAEGDRDPPPAPPIAQLRRYVEAFEHDDPAALVALLRHR
ncbi:MAG TPA: RNA polymerase subunit sigma-70 [Acidimicrobiales bacterium]